MLEQIGCPYCASTSYSAYGSERGYTTVRCAACGFLYVNPRPAGTAIDTAVRTGVHAEDASQLNVVARRDDRKVAEYSEIFRELFADVWERNVPVRWLDVGAGYGEIMRAVLAIAPAGSEVEGVEPMRPKAEAARAMGLKVDNDYLRRDRAKVKFASIIDVFSHIPDFHAFLADVRAVLLPGGELFIETGNLADLPKRSDFPGELGLPDHLTFAGEKHLRGFLDRAGFDVVRVEKRRIDNLLYFAKNVAKRMLGRPVRVAVPFTSDYRRLLIRARLRPISE